MWIVNKRLQLDIGALLGANCKVKLCSNCCWNDSELKTFLWQSSSSLSSPPGEVYGVCGSLLVDYGQAWISCSLLQCTQVLCRDPTQDLVDNLSYCREELLSCRQSFMGSPIVHGIPGHSLTHTHTDEPNLKGLWCSFSDPNQVIHRLIIIPLLPPKTHTNTYMHHPLFHPHCLINILLLTPDFLPTQHLHTHVCTHLLHFCPNPYTPLLRESS